MDAKKQQKVERFLSHVHGAYRFDEETGESVKLQPEEGCVHIVRAAGLKQADMYDGSDPYAIVFWNDVEVGRTPVFEDSCNPEFNAKFFIRVPLSDMHENTLRVELFDFDDSALDDEPDFMGQCVLRGEGSEALPRHEVVYPLTKKMEYEGWIHTANHSYKNPYNDAVGGKLTLRYSLRAEDESVKVVVRDGKEVIEKKTLADSRAPHISATPLDFSYCEIATPEDIAAAAARRDPPIPEWSEETVRTLKLKLKKSSVRPRPSRQSYKHSSSKAVSQSSVPSASSDLQPEPEPEPCEGKDIIDGASDHTRATEGRISPAESSNRSRSPATAQQGTANIHPKLEAVVEDAFVRIFEFLHTEKLTTVHLFHAMDKDNSGTIDAEEFTHMLNDMGMQLTKAERRLCIAKLDVDGDGSVDLHEFVDRMASIRRRQLAGKHVDGLQKHTDADDPIEVVDGINLKNNQLTQLEGIGSALRPFLMCNLTATLQWLDLSFNQLDTLYGQKTVTKNTLSGKVDMVVVTEPLMELQNLAILNLHCNQFREMKTIAPLSKLTRLEKLTLHGNPMEEGVKGYRSRVLALVPWLRQLDYVTVTAKDKDAAKQHRESMKRKKVAKAQRDDGGGASAQARTNTWRGGMGAQKTMLGRRR